MYSQLTSSLVKDTTSSTRQSGAAGCVLNILTMEDFEESKQDDEQRCIEVRAVRISIVP